VTLLPQVTALIGQETAMSAGGDVSVVAESHRAVANVTTRGFSAGGVAIGTVANDGIVSPTAHSSIADNTTVLAKGRVDVHADILAQTDNAGGVALNDFFQPASDVDVGADTIRFASHGLSTGAIVTYDPNGNTPLQTAGGPLSPPPASGHCRRRDTPTANTASSSSTATTSSWAASSPPVRPTADCCSPRRPASMRCAT
jgi:hypothetical protein